MHDPMTYPVDTKYNFCISISFYLKAMINVRIYFLVIFILIRFLCFVLDYHPY